MTKTLPTILAFIAALALGCQFAGFFGIATCVASFCVFSKIEADQNVYDVGFWFTRYPSARLLACLRAFGKLESVVRSLLLGLLAWFTFAGNDQARVLDATARLCVAVLVSYALLSFLVRKAHLNVLRWAYVKLSVILGVAFSILSVLTHDTRKGFVQFAGEAMMQFGKWLKELLWPWSKKPTIGESVDKIHNTIHSAVELIHGALDKAVGEPVASVLMVLFNSEILMGFMVVLYTFLLLLLTNPELRRRPEDGNATEEPAPHIPAHPQNPSER